MSTGAGRPGKNSAFACCIGSSYTSVSPNDDTGLSTRGTGSLSENAVYGGGAPVPAVGSAGVGSAPPP
ncbi:hypothetical protein GCM10010363_75100 [Streptomyces omiyaensis]|nr:hypothetical protein GCM10010363_75100 [Streptomyces omiyaensis]